MSALSVVGARSKSSRSIRLKIRASGVKRAVHRAESALLHRRTTSKREKVQLVAVSNFAVPPEFQVHRVRVCRKCAWGRLRVSSSLDASRLIE